MGKQDGREERIRSRRVEGQGPNRHNRAVKRLLTHPSLPLVLGLAALLMAGLLLAATALLPDLFRAQAAGDKVQQALGDVAAAVLPDGEDDDSASSAPASGSYVLQVRDQYVQEKRTFVEADLTAMSLKVYRDGEVAIDVPIKTKGKEGSWWETPVGVYSVKSKERNHFSTFGHVYQPWSLVFQGNFFIHGWPYYPDGTPVSGKYSGGCIRLDDENAKLVFDAVDVSTPVLVYKAPQEAPALPDFSGNPPVNAGYTVLDVPTGTTVRSRDAGNPIPFGQAVHLLTALTAVDYINVESRVSVDQPGSPRLAAMRSASVLDLLRLLLSEHDAGAAHAIADVRSEKTFVKYMNAKAAAIGMGHTQVASVDPADEGNVTTVGDLAILARYLAENRSFVLGLTKSARGNLAYDPPVWDDLRFSGELRALPGFFGGVGDGPAVAVLALTIDGIERQVAIAGSSLADIAEAASWLTR